jgi:hypothetical protein
MLPPIIKDKRNEPPMNDRLTALVKRVAELREAGLKACHWIEEFHLRRIHPLGHQEKLAFECLRLFDPSQRQAYIRLLTFLFHAAMSQEEIDRFMSRLFDKDPPTAQPDTLSLPYSDENHPPSVRITVLLITFILAIYTFLWLVTHDLYPDREIDVALSDEDNAWPNELVGDDARGNRAHSAETLTPNPIGFSSAGETRPSAIDQAIPTAPSGGGQKKKRIVLRTKRKHNKATDDQVIIELSPYHGPRNPLDIVVIEHLFGHLFEAF